MDKQTVRMAYVIFLVLEYRVIDGILRFKTSYGYNISGLNDAFTKYMIASKRRNSNED